jgi:hypothetical protein
MEKGAKCDLRELDVTRGLRPKMTKERVTKESCVRFSMMEQESFLPRKMAQWDRLMKAVAAADGEKER